MTRQSKNELRRGKRNTEATIDSVLSRQTLKTGTLQQHCAHKNWRQEQLSFRIANVQKRGEVWGFVWRFSTLVCILSFSRVENALLDLDRNSRLECCTKKIVSTLPSLNLTYEWNNIGGLKAQAFSSTVPSKVLYHVTCSTLLPS